jgi:hypothetical protein
MVTEDGWPVFINIGNSADEILKQAALSARIKSAEVNILGITVDANDKFDARWSRIRSFCNGFFNAVPQQCPTEGLILQNEDGKRFGAWIMPNNQSNGMVEDFCKLLVPTVAEPIWTFARASVTEARNRGARYRDAHQEKANIHTWLAWQDPPGERMGAAITKKILDPSAPSAKVFVRWFRELYRV